MHPKQYNIDITHDYWLGECYQNDGWKRLTLFHKKTNSQGGSINTPIAEIDIIKHPGQNGCNSHDEIKFSIRNDVKRQGSEIVVDKNDKHLRHTSDVIDTVIIDKAVDKLKETDLVTLPICIYVCMKHVEDFKTQGDFWTNDWTWPESIT
jgi:hypothetical protein